MAFCISEDFSLAELGISVLQFWVVLYYNKHPYSIYSQKVFTFSSDPLQIFSF